MTAQSSTSRRVAEGWCVAPTLTTPLRTNLDIQLVLTRVALEFGRHEDRLLAHRDCRQCALVAMIMPAEHKNIPRHEVSDSKSIWVWRYS